MRHFRKLEFSAACGAPAYLHAARTVPACHEKHVCCCLQCDGFKQHAPCLPAQRPRNPLDRPLSTHISTPAALTPPLLAPAAGQGAEGATAPAALLYIHFCLVLSKCLPRCRTRRRRRRAWLPPAAARRMRQQRRRQTAAPVSALAGRFWLRGSLGDGRQWKEVEGEWGHGRLLCWGASCAAAAITAGCWAAGAKGTQPIAHQTARCRVILCSLRGQRDYSCTPEELQMQNSPLNCAPTAQSTWAAWTIRAPPRSCKCTSSRAAPSTA